MYVHVLRAYRPGPFVAISFRSMADPTRSHYVLITSLFKFTRGDIDRQQTG